THRARLPCAQAAQQHTVRSDRRYAAAMDRFAGLLAEDWLVAHEQLPQSGFTGPRPARGAYLRDLDGRRRYDLTSDATAGLRRYGYSFGFGLVVRSAHSPKPSKGLANERPRRVLLAPVVVHSIDDALHVVVAQAAAVMAAGAKAGAGVD